MGNLPGPYEEIEFKWAAVQRLFVQHAMEDNEMCPKELAIYSVINEGRDITIDKAARKSFGDYVEKGGDICAYMNRLAAPLRMKVVHLADYRHGSKVVAFTARDDDDFAG